MITRDIEDTDDNVFRDMSNLDLVEELRVHLHEDTNPPVDLVAALEANGMNINALSVDIMRGK